MKNRLCFSDDKIVMIIPTYTGVTIKLSL